MTEEMLFNQMHILRTLTCQAVSDVSEAQAEQIPAGFRNNIRWNLGHILVIQEFLLFRLCGEALALSDDYFRMFGRGTSPADWPLERPSIAELCSLLEDQTERVRTTFSGRLGEPARRPFVWRAGVELKTIGEILSFSLIHEGMHQGSISALKRVTEKADA